MENTNERVLAYTLAKEIPYEELSEISGGAADWISCTKISGQASGSTGQWDSSTDLVIDW